MFVVFVDFYFMSFVVIWRHLCGHEFNSLAMGVVMSLDIGGRLFLGNYSLSHEPASGMSAPAAPEKRNGEGVSIDGWEAIEQRLSEGLRSVRQLLAHQGTSLSWVAPSTEKNVDKTLPPPVFSTRRDEKPSDILSALTATRCHFGENFDNSTHAAVIQMMMMTFGQSPLDLFDEVKASGDGYDVTMKDEFKVHVSHEELKLVAQAARFAGNDRAVIQDANFVLAAFAKRKQQAGNHGSFEKALTKTLEGETLRNCLRGMGVSGLVRYVPATEMAASGAPGVVGTHNFGSALVMDNHQYRYAEKQRVDNRYGYIFFNDQTIPDQSPITIDGDDLNLSRVPVGIKPTDIWSGFYQGAEGNCVTVSAIKAAMMRFGQNPQGIYKKVSATAQGYEVVMRDSFKLRVTHEELVKAREASNLKGYNQALLDDANFLYCVSAKRAELEDNDFCGKQGFDVAMGTLNDGEHPGEALRRLGLSAYVHESSVQELAGGAIGTLANSHHSVVVIDGMLDMYGQKLSLAQSGWKGHFQRALKLV